MGEELAVLLGDPENRGIGFGLYYSILEWSHPSQHDYKGFRPDCWLS
ncbi:hypothetical protein ACIBMX_44760 [Streptomyces phaeochromogenes]